MLFALVDFLADPADMLCNNRSIRFPVKPPDLIVNLLFFKHLPAMGNQKLYNGKFCFRQACALSVHKHLSA